MSVIYTIFGFLLRVCYTICNSNFVFALILFTLIAKLLMMPMAFSQQKNSVKMQKMKPEMDKIRRQYANNQQKQQEEMQKLYEKHNYKMTAGCLPMLIQLPIIMGLYGVIYSPMTYVLQMTKTEIVGHAKDVLNTVAQHFGADSNSYKLVETVANTAAESYTAEGTARGAEIIIAKAAEKMDFDLFGIIDLSSTPSLSVFNWLWLIPLMVAVSQIISSYLSMKMTGQEINGSTKMMVFGMPLISVIFSFQFPGAIGFYWALNSLLQIPQSFLVKNIYSPEREERKAAARKEKERAEKMDRLRRLHGDDEPLPPTPATPAEKPIIKDDPEARKEEGAKEPEKPELSKKQKKQQDRDRLRKSREGL